MNKLSIAIVVAIAAALSSANCASAQYPGFLGGYGCGSGYNFYGGFGGGYRTPPYFAMHPPVYYGARYARPYGMSPFPASPMVTAPESYRGRLESEFIQPGVPRVNHSSNPCVSCSTAFSVEEPAQGPVRSNPFVEGEATPDQLVSTGAVR
ncbi:hypothetical protein [Novipirellula artificiosorum]|uniref:Uncharacterized protein n=1 Tax=Novipirellula artificiosorum TaxID=2528016 RepID=A0A5C6DTM4_9BACT|nr:hypothetical protein [Novipirellula artificiosorum]TWU39665.1 hypothetical protein Poly41_25210 [Novipirellula artificiosorum]